MALVFVYGTLKSGGRLNSVMAKDEFLGEAYTVNEAFDLFSNGSFPYLWHGKYRVRGELWDVSDDTMNRLHMIEGVPHHYQTIEPIVAYEKEGAKAEVKATAFIASRDYNFHVNSGRGINYEKGTNAKWWESN